MHPEPALVPPPELPADAHKGNAGRLLCLCGSPTMPGAANLVVRAAQRAGCGLVTLGVFQRELVGMITPASPETVFLDLSRSKDLYAGRLPAEIVHHRHDARVAGPGLGQGGQTRELVRRLIGDAFPGPLVLDADALNVVAGSPEALAEHAAPLVLTPHPGEAERLLERSIPAQEDGRVACAVELAHLTRGICVLKGARTVVSDGQRHWVNSTGNPGLATAGTGDVLAGILGAYLAAAVQRGAGRFGPFEAACAAVWVHGLAGDLAARELGQAAVIASDLVANLGRAQREAFP